MKLITKIPTLNNYKDLSDITHIKVSDFDFAGLCARIEQPKLSRTSADTAKTAYLTENFAKELKEYIERNKITDFIFQGHYTTNQYFYSIKLQHKICQA